MDREAAPGEARLASVVIRTYNEQKHLGRLLEAIKGQDVGDVEVEVVVVDSGSTDDTVAIAESFDCRITSIQKEEFSFGRSLNIGCAFARGHVLVFVSGHCIPASDRWLAELVAPLLDGTAQYSYGRQIAAETTKFSERQIFAKYFPAHSIRRQEGFFCNNANAAITREAWREHKFDETLTGLEDMHMAKRLIATGGYVSYVAEAPVHHIHDESWAQVRHRYEREALAMQEIAPNMHVDSIDCARFFLSGVALDFSKALDQKALGQNVRSIVAFRLMQYVGTYRGNREHRKLSQRMKLRYYYPSTAHHPPREDRGSEPESISSAI